MGGCCLGVVGAVPGFGRRTEVVRRAPAPREQGDAKIGMRVYTNFCTVPLLRADKGTQKHAISVRDRNLKLPPSSFFGTLASTNPGTAGPLRHRPMLTLARGALLLGPPDSHLKTPSSPGGHVAGSTGTAGARLRSSLLLLLQISLKCMTHWRCDSNKMTPTSPQRNRRCRQRRHKKKKKKASGVLCEQVEGAEAKTRRVLQRSRRLMCERVASSRYTFTYHPGNFKHTPTNAQAHISSARH